MSILWSIPGVLALAMIIATKLLARRRRQRLFYGLIRYMDRVGWYDTVCSKRVVCIPESDWQEFMDRASIKPTYEPKEGICNV